MKKKTWLQVYTEADLAEGWEHTSCEAKKGDIITVTNANGKVIVAVNDRILYKTGNPLIKISPTGDLKWPGLEPIKVSNRRLTKKELQELSKSFFNN